MSNPAHIHTARTAAARALLARLVGLEALLVVADLFLIALPLQSWMRAQAHGPPVGSPRFPVIASARTLAVLGTTLVLVLEIRIFSVLKPTLDGLVLKSTRNGLAPAAIEAMQRGMTGAPREAGQLRLAWSAVLIALAALSMGRAPDLWGWGALLALLILGGGSAAALRCLVLEAFVDRLRPLVLPNFDRMRLYAVGYRGRLMRGGVVLVGAAAWESAVLLAQLHELSDHARLIVAVLGAPVLGLAALLGWGALRHRARTIDSYFSATLWQPNTKGPVRDEPTAAPAFNAAQALPYRLALYFGFGLTLSFVVAIAVGRRLIGFDTGLAARLLVAQAVVVGNVTLYEVAFARAVLRPFLRHLGSRHSLPLADIRSPVGLAAKVIVGFIAVAALACGCLLLAVWGWNVQPGAGRTWVPVLVPVLGGAFCLAGLIAWITTQILAPIRALESRSEDMAKGELARPVAPAGEADELGRLTVAFEGLRRSLRDKLRSTESINVDLEREVRRRTEVLELRNVELRDALEKLRRAQDNLVRSEKLASMGRLVAGIAHEINNPVNAVINSLAPLDELVRQMASVVAPPVAGQDDLQSLGAEAGNMLAVIQRGAARTKAIVQALHNYSRSDDTTFRSVQLARSVDDSLDLLRHRLRAVTVDKHVDPEARIQGLPGQIDQVLMNLITNAVQAMEPQGGLLRISTVRRGDDWVLSICDQGAGIDPEALPRIFDPFFTTKAVGEGSGLGLSIVHGIVERHAGRIEVESQLGLGTTFRVVFPAFADAATA